MSVRAQPPGILKRLWYRWRSLRLPWRRQFLVGADLMGNTFWEFKDALNANRFRRIVRYGRAAHYADIKISPQWHQWLRHTRFDAPTIQEQELDVSRQAQMKQLAAKADERWRSQESFLDAPKHQQPVPAIGVNDPGGYAAQTEPEQRQGVRNAVEDASNLAAAAEGSPTDDGRFKGKTKQKEPNPWAKADRGAEWQPTAWAPGPVKRR